MKAASFEYHAPTTVDEVVSVLADHGGEAKPLAGGQSLVPLLALRLARFEHLVDLQNVDELARIDRTDGELAIGAMVRQSRAEHDPVVAEAAPLVAAALPHIGHFQIRNRGTIGGSIAHADPASELPAVALALGATLDVQGPGGLRSVDAGEFFESTWTTAVDDDEILVRTRFPIWSGRRGSAVEEFARRPGDFAIAGAAVSVALGEDGRIERAGIAMFGMGATPIRSVAAEAALVGSAPPDAAGLDEVGRLAAADADPADDLHATADYRTKVGAHLVTRALTRAITQAGEEARRV